MENATHAPVTIKFGVFEVDLCSGEVHKAGVQIKIQGQPFKILTLLLEHPGQVVSREDLRRKIWPNESFGDFDHAVNMAVGKLRAALGDSADTPLVIETLHRRGYRFIAPVSASPLGWQSTNGVATPEQKPKRPTWTSVLALTVAGVALLGTGLGIRRFFSRPDPPNMLTMEIQRLTNNGAASSAAISPDGKFVAYVLTSGEKQSLRLRQVATLKDVELLAPAAVDFHRGGMAFSPDGTYLYFVRSDEKNIFFKYLYRISVLGGPEKILIKDVDSPPSFSPDGHQFSFERSLPAQNSTNILIADEDGSGEHVAGTIQDTNPSYNPGTAWSPDGRTIAVPVFHVSTDPRYAMYSIGVKDGKTRELYSRTAGLIGRPIWVRDGKSLLVPLGEQMSPKFQLWDISYPEGQAARVSNDLTNYEFRIDMAADGKTMAVAAKTWLSNVWVASANQLSAARRITSGETPLFDGQELPDGKIVADDLEHHLWVINAEGSDRERVLAKEAPLWFGICGQQIVFLRFDNPVSLMRSDLDGANLAVIFRGDVFDPSCSRDGAFVYYVNWEAPEKVWRVPIKGGAPQAISDVAGEGSLSELSVSPDGKLLTYIYGTTKPMAWNLSVVRTEGGPLVQHFVLPGGSTEPRWSPDGKRLQYLVTREGVTNLWEQPLAGGKPRQLTNFSSGQIWDYSWSWDQRRLFLSRGSVSSDVVIMRDVK